jgi:hypothetical protein
MIPEGHMRVDPLNDTGFTADMGRPNDLVTECRYVSGGLIELKCAIRGSLGSLGPREMKKKRRMHVSAPSFEDTSVSIVHRYVIFKKKYRYLALRVGYKKKKTSAN